jgi:hypothetical protein
LRAAGAKILYESQALLALTTHVYENDVIDSRTRYEFHKLSRFIEFLLDFVARSF